MSLIYAFGTATEEQKAGLLSTHLPGTFDLQGDEFAGVDCFELWLDSELVGLTGIAIEDRSSPEHNTLRIHSLGMYLAPELRGEGVGRLFSQLVLGTLRQMIVNHVSRTRRQQPVVEIQFTHYQHTAIGISLITSVAKSFDHWLDALCCAYQVRAEVAIVFD